MPEPTAPPPLPPQLLCDSDELLDKGKAHVFDVLHYRSPARAFVLRFEGRLVAYLNRCVHVPTEMDWQEGEFLDGDREWIVCSIHGAAYDPVNGRCRYGPCGRGALTAVEVRESAGKVYWYPSRDLRPVFVDEPAAASPPTPESPA